MPRVVNQGFVQPIDKPLGGDAISPSQSFYTVTKSDTDDLPNGVCKGIYIGTAGDVTVLNAEGAAVTFTALVVGIIHPIRTKRVMSTNTTATGIVVVY